MRLVLLRLMEKLYLLNSVLNFTLILTAVDIRYFRLILIHYLVIILKLFILYLLMTKWHFIKLNFPTSNFIYNMILKYKIYIYIFKQTNITCLHFQVYCLSEFVSIIGSMISIIDIYFISKLHNYTII